MRKIEALMVAAVEKKKNFTRGNTRVEYSVKYGTANVYLHNNLIAMCGDELIEINQDVVTTWNTRTMRSRLNALCTNVLGSGFFSSKNFRLHAGGVNVEEYLDRRLGGACIYVDGEEIHVALEDTAALVKTLMVSKGYSHVVSVGRRYFFGRERYK